MNITIIEITIVYVISSILVVGLSIGGAFDYMETQAIERGYALHCPVSGDFAWKGECDE